MDFNKRKLMKYCLLLLILSTLTFIFVNSMLPADTSSEESEAVSGWLSDFLPESSVIVGFIIDNIRKIAHFVEFGVLGAELTAYTLFFTKKLKATLPIAQIIAFFVAFTDETIQIFSGRGPEIADVWIDFFGSLTFSLLTCAVYILCKRTRMIRRREDDGGKDQIG